MAQVNRKGSYKTITTHEGGVAKRIDEEKMLRRSVLSCMLWEDGFYEDGEEIAERIADLTSKVPTKNVMALAKEARENFKLRHVPLLLMREAARKGGEGIAKGIYDIIQRPDEIAEFLAIYWKDGKQPVSAQTKKGLGRAFNKFNEYQLAKYNRSGRSVSLRDALFISHAKPKDDAQAALFKKLVDGTLETPDTWEVGLSTGGDKKSVFTRLLSEKKLGTLALLRNLRNMESAGVDSELVGNAIRTANYGRVLPFRFIAAEKYAPRYSAQLEEAMLTSLANFEKLDGKTIILVDVSGSMVWGSSSYSEMNNIDRAAALAILLREISDTRVFTFDTNVRKIPARKGFALRDAIMKQAGGETHLGNAVKQMNSVGYDRLIVITDEQSADSVPNPITDRGYMINVASNKNGVGYGKWVHIDGFSEAVIDFIAEYEKEFLQ